MLDNTRDGKIDAKDARFGELKVWTDRNGDGVSQSDELRSLSDMGIVEIGLRIAPVAARVKPGENAPLSTATFKWTNGVTSTIGTVAMAFDPSSTKPKLVTVDGPATLPTPDEGAAALAAARLMQAMSGFGVGSADAGQTSEWVEHRSATPWFAAAAA